MLNYILFSEKPGPGLLPDPDFMIEALFSALQMLFYTAIALYKKVTIWPLVQVAFGLKVVEVVPFVTPFSTAQRTAS